MSRVRGAGAIFKRKRIAAGSRRNVTRIREPVGCEPMECCPWSSRGEHGRHERGVHDQELLIVNAAGRRDEGRLHAKAWRRTTDRTPKRVRTRTSQDGRGCKHREGKHDVSVVRRARNVTVRLGTKHGRRAIFGASQGAKRMNARASKHPQGCERHAKHIAASRAPHRKMHEAATLRALPPKRWIRPKGGELVTPLPDRRIERCGRQKRATPSSIIVR